MTGKYSPLYKWLNEQPSEKTAIELSFRQIEKIIGSTLPRSAFQYEAWWLDKSANTRHMQAVAWLEAGWRVVNLSLRSRRVSFVRA
jgi:hypothetical protein